MRIGEKEVCAIARPPAASATIAIDLVLTML
jgi:hypothetical protein